MPPCARDPSMLIGDIMKKLGWILLLAAGMPALGRAESRLVQNSAELVPAGYVVFEKLQGDLNSDRQMDDIFIIKKTDKENIVKNRFGEMVDRNPRGLVIAFKKGHQYELALENRDCFDSENEDGGVYFAPELSMELDGKNLFIHYGHGRYGSWEYQFQYRHSDFELIGYFASLGGSVIDREISINFITKKMLIRDNMDQSAEPGKEKFVETWKRIRLTQPMKLREMKDFLGFEPTAFD